jgi:hypothetical protein
VHRCALHRIRETQVGIMLTLERVGKTYPNGVHALGGVSLDVGPGERYIEGGSIIVSGDSVSVSYSLAVRSKPRFPDAVQRAAVHR